ncbi:MAG: hypothetical protein H6737_10485 [Alphaproteobacteria bacterium]|nr:hypothetical protein [Alphaproteobacteria bacterium]
MANIAFVLFGFPALAGVAPGDTGSATGGTGIDDSGFDTAWFLDSGGSGDTGGDADTDADSDSDADTDSDTDSDTDTDTGPAARDTGSTTTPITGTATDLAGEQGGSPWSDGCGCASGAGSSGAVGLFALFGGLVVLRRRENSRQLG